MKKFLGSKRRVCPTYNGFSFFITEKEKCELLDWSVVEDNELRWVHITNKSDLCTIWHPKKAHTLSIPATTMAKWLSTQPWFKSQVLETKATYFMSLTETCAKVSRSCADSMKMWGIGDKEVIRATKEYTLWANNSQDNDRIGYIYESGELRCNIHFTGSGVGWGSLTQGRLTADLIYIPASLAHNGRSLYSLLTYSREWKQISNPAFELFKHNDETGFVVQPKL
jgi:hypothetical protein